MDRRWWGLLAASAGIVGGVVARSCAGGAWWGWVVQNLVLAWIPIVIGALATRSRAALWLLGPAWLAFLPNAPYLLTDLVHLAPRRAVPLWFDACLLGGLGALGLALGARSLRQVVDAVERFHGPRAATALLVGCPPLSGFAMVLGRELRFNSWELATAPAAVARASAALVLGVRHHPEPAAMALVFGVAFGAAVWAAGDRPGAWRTLSS